MGEPSAFGRFLRERRKLLDLTQEALAERAGYSVSTIRKLELGVLRPSRNLLERLADVLQLEPGEQADMVWQARMLPADASDELPVRRERGNIPASPTPLLGRDAELSHLVTLVLRPDVRLATVTGPGGAGKTRLAVEAAHHVRGAFPDGVWWVDLAPIPDASLVLSAIARALGLVEIGSAEHVHAVLREQQALLLLDNFEHVQVAAGTVAGLLSAVPGLKVLTTSRALLRIRGGHVVPLESLALPGREEASAAAVGRYAAVQLFVARAQAVDPSFQLTDDTARTIADICVQLDGLPLAIELAAARANLFTPHSLLARLDRPLSLLVNGPRDLPRRQRTLEAAIDWSYALLAPNEQRLFTRLAVFTGGCALQSVEALSVGLDGTADDVLDMLASLVNSSLLQRQAGIGGEPRYAMFQTIRAFALQRLGCGDEAPWVSRVHAEHFASLAEEAATHLQGPEQKAWLDRLECEHDNLRVALRWALEQREQTIVLRLAAAMPRFWWTRGYLGEGRMLLQQVLHDVADLPPPLHAQLLYWEGVFAKHLGDSDAARRALERSLELCQTIANQRGIAQASNALGMVANAQGDYKRAQRYYATGLAMYRKLGDPERSATLLNNLGYTAILLDEYDDALALLQESLAIARSIPDALGVAYALNNLGLLALRRGEYMQASSLLLQALELFASLADARNSAEALEALAEVVARQGRLENAACFLGAASGLRRRTGTTHTAHEQMQYRATLALLHAGLDDEHFATAWTSGVELDLRQAVAFAVTQLGAESDAAAANARADDAAR
ncbi:MAG TPA: tetratricopeptide repeat protein [Herpetosiphonaceae bacterium]|nr:tetratricopeptide repeat protein [Herpetosiphonaceae bacterium]